MLEMPAARIGVEVAADETQLLDAAAQLAHAGGKVRLGALRQHADADEGFGKQLRHAVDQVVAVLRPGLGHLLVADVMRHGGCARRKDRQIRTAFPDQPQLVVLDRLADLVIRNLGIGGRILAFLEGGLLLLAPLVVALGQHGVMAMAIDDQAHSASPFLNLRQSSAWPAIWRWRRIVPSVISGSTPSSSNVRALSAISAARRSPCVVIRSTL